MFSLLRKPVTHDELAARIETLLEGTGRFVSEG